MTATGEDSSMALNEVPRRASRRGLHLNGATIMTTPTSDHVLIARRTGYVGVEVRAERLLGAPDEVRAAASIVRRGEVWSLNGLQVKLAADGRPRRDLLDDELPPRLEICRSLSAGYLLVVPPRILGLAPGVAIQGMRTALALIRDKAASARVGVAFEFLGFADCPIDSPSRAADVVDGLAGVDLVLDSCHWHASGSESLNRFPVERLRMVHLNDAPAKPPREVEDADRLLPTLGVIRLRRLVDELRSAGYDGPWSLETFNPDYWKRDPEQVAREGRQLTERLLGSLIAS
jgi:2-keto-myo-inositol isomerase